MARYSARTGPTANFELTAPFVTIPGFTITRSWDHGELFIAFGMTILNGTAAGFSHGARVLLDDQVVGPDNWVQRSSAGFQIVISGSLMTTIAAGAHLIELQADGAAAAGDVVQAGRCTLTVIQLPLWDTDVDIITL